MDTDSVVRMAAVLFVFGCSGCAGSAATPEPTPASAPSVDPRLAEQIAIGQLIDRATDAINHHEWGVLEALFTKDATWEALPPIGWRLEGRAAIRGFLTKNEGKVEVLSYSLTAPAIEIQSPTRATARSTMTELLHLIESGSAVQLVGTYFDDFVKQEGRWRFSRRRFRLRYEDDVALPERRSGAGGEPRSILGPASNSPSPTGTKKR